MFEKLLQEKLFIEVSCIVKLLKLFISMRYTNIKKINVVEISYFVISFLDFCICVLHEIEYGIKYLVCQQFWNISSAIENPCSMILIPWVVSRNEWFVFRTKYYR